MSTSKSSTSSSSPQLASASLQRRLAAMFYDSLLIVAMWMATTSVIVIFITKGPIVHVLPLQVFFYVEAFFFYLLFWRMKGQTLGMQVWKIRLVSDSGGKPGYLQCLVRFLVATVSIGCLGLGIIWMLWDPRRLTWQDRLSNTRAVFLGKAAYQQ